MFWLSSVWVEQCNDGYITTSERWEDGNVANGDGWSSSWLIENGYYWTTSVPNVCYTICGDSKRAGSEQWDDGDLTSNDGWSKLWVIETGWSCIGKFINS